MIRMSKETDYGIMLLTHLANLRSPLQLSARELAARTRVPLPMVSKILKTLAREGVLVSHRGAKGGYLLARNPKEISIADVVRALEGPFALTECIESPGDCRQESVCGVRRNWQKINQTVKTALEEISLAEMSQPLNDQLVPLRSDGARIQ